MILCANCGEVMRYIPEKGMTVHAATKLPQCSLRDNEARVNAQKRTNDLRRMTEGVKR